MTDIKSIDLTVAAIGNRSRVVVDGLDISSAVSAVDLHTSVDHISTMTLKLPLRAPTQVSGDARVVVDNFTASLLKAIGWTPPDGAA